MRRAFVIGVAYSLYAVLLFQPGASAQQVVPQPTQPAPQAVVGPAITPEGEGLATNEVPPSEVRTPRIQFGHLSVLPTLDLLEEFNDNIFLGRSGVPQRPVKSDFITHVIPGLGLLYDLPERGKVSLKYGAEMAFYAKDSNNDWTTQRLLFDSNYNVPGGLIFGLANDYIRAEDPYSDVNQYNLGQKTKRWYDDLRTRFGYNFGERLRVIGYYGFYVQDYDRRVDFTQDFNRNQFGGGLEARVASSTWAFIRYFYGQQDYTSHMANVTEQNDASFTQNQVTTGLTWDPGGKLLGQVSFGYLWRDYNNRFDASGASYGNPDFFTMETSVSYVASPNTMLTLNLVRLPRDSGAGTKEYFTETGTSLNLRQKLFTKFDLTAGVGYANDDYNTGRNDDNYTVNLGIAYRLQDWLSATVGYGLLKKESNDPTQSFTDNRIFIGLRGAY